MPRPLVKTRGLSRRAFLSRYAAFVAAKVNGKMLAGSFLEYVSVTNAVSTDYGNRLSVLMEYVTMHGLPFETDGEAEQAVVQSLNQ